MQQDPLSKWMQSSIRQSHRARTVGLTGFLALSCLYVLLIAHLSLYPYQGWRNIGIGPFDFVVGPWVPIHQSILWGDVFINVLGYVPFTLFLMLGLGHQSRAFRVWVSLLGAAVLSLCLEALQTFLPARVPSMVDWVTNIAGALCGVLLGLMCVGFSANTNRLWLLRVNAWFEYWWVDRAWMGTALLALWFLALLPPQYPSFGLGVWLGNWVNVVEAGQVLDNPILPFEWVLHIEMMVAHWMNYCFLVAVCLMGLAYTQPGAPRLRLSVMVLFFSFLLRSVHIMIDTSTLAWLHVLQLWLESNAIGVVLAVLMVLVLSLMSLASHQLARLALLHVLLGWLVTMVLPGFHDPSFSPQGHGVMAVFVYLQEAGRWVGKIWPILAIGVLCGLCKSPSHNSFTP